MKRYLSRIGLSSGLLVLLVAVLLGSVVYPASAASNRVELRQATTPVPATIYLPTTTLKPIFQQNIDQQVPKSVDGAMNHLLGSLPAENRDWAQKMANTLIQPSAELTSLEPQEKGLSTGVKLSLYPGDPKPTTSNMLVQFGMQDTSTIGVKAAQLDQSPALVTGPLTTMKLPFGSLKGVQATPGCGDSGLSINMQMPLSLGTANAQTANAQTNVGGLATYSPLSYQVPAENKVDAYVELPASSLAQLGNSIDRLPVNNSLIAKNITLTPDGNGNLSVQAGVYLGVVKLGTATSTLKPTAENGNLAVKVTNTTMTILAVFKFPYNTYNQQMEKTLNGMLNNAMGGKFTVTQAAMGTNSHIPCAAGDSLILTGNTTI